MHFFALSLALIAACLRSIYVANSQASLDDAIPILSTNMKSLKLNDNALVFCFRTATGTACDGLLFDANSINEVQPLGVLIISTTIEGEDIVFDRINDNSFIVCFGSTASGIAVGGRGEPQASCTAIKINEANKLALLSDEYVSVCERKDSCFDLTLSVFSEKHAIVCYSLESKKSSKSECGLINIDLNMKGKALSMTKNRLRFKEQGTRSLVTAQISSETALVCYAVPSPKIDQASADSSGGSKNPPDHLKGECFVAGIAMDSSSDSDGSLIKTEILKTLIDARSINGKATSDIVIAKFEKDHMATCFFSEFYQLICKSLKIRSDAIEIGSSSIITEDQTVYDIKMSRISSGLVSVCYGDGSSDHSCYMLSKSDTSSLRRRSKKILFDVSGMSFDGSIVSKGNLLKYPEVIANRDIEIQTWLADNQFKSAETDISDASVPTAAATAAPTIAEEIAIPNSILCHSVRFNPNEEQKICRIFRNNIDIVPAMNLAPKKLVAEPGYCESLQQAWQCESRSNICEWDGAQCRPDA